MKPLKASLLVAAIAGLLSAAAASGQPQYCSAPYHVEQGFPTAGPEQTRWKLCWQVLDGPSAVITGAWFRPDPAAAWIKVIYDARLSELFVPYHPGSPRYLDVAFGFPPVPLGTTDCRGPTGVILGRRKELCKEVRDRGLAWKHDELSRRGEELVLWSVLAAANYNYVIEWTFRDDGIVLGRVGATGQIAGTDAHMHGPIWRLDVDLDGACCDTVAQSRHAESGAGALDSMTVVPSETGVGWDPLSFTMLHVHDAALKNTKGRPSGWHLMPSREGTPVHLEPFTKYPFWVTRYRWSETFGNDLPSYVSSPEPVDNADTVLWYYGGMHHLVRDEDTEMTHLMWLGFMLRPHNVWAKTPLHP